MEPQVDIGTALVQNRRAQGLSQRELGERLGVRQQQIARWEAALYRTAPLGRVEAVALELGLKMVVRSAGVEAATVAEEAMVPYGAPAVAAALPQAATTGAVAPVRDLGEIAARIRANGAIFRDRYSLERIGVFGSFVHGEQTPDSDVDLLVETEDPGGFRFIEAADFAEGVLGRHVDFVRPHLLRERLRIRVLEEALYVWTA
jgi:predicted nucleotidyltransferase